tara:strand:- start:3202 stop:3675 length:474 start_codon:yes stop_codon:yes gene_type:complete
MAFAYAKQDGYIKATETITIASGAGDTAGSSLPCTGARIVLAQMDEVTHLEGKLQYTMDSGQDVTVGGVGADPSSALSSSTMTWYDAKQTEGNAETAGAGDDILEAYFVPKNAQYVRVLYTAGGSYGGGSEATEIWLDGVKSDLGLVMTNGIGIDPS